MFSPPSKKDDTLLIVIVVAVAAIVIVGGLVIGLAIMHVSENGDRSKDLSLTVLTARWEELDSHGLKADQGSQWLWISVEARNNGSVALSINAMYFLLTVHGGTEYSTIDNWGPDGLGARGTGIFGFVFSLPLNSIPEQIIYRDVLGDISVAANVPTPSPVTPDVVISAISSQKQPYDLDGIVWTVPGETFLWISFHMRNAWTSDIDTGTLEFKLEGSDGSIEYVWDKNGPDVIGTGDGGDITLVFIVNLEFIPKVLDYEMLFGPFCSVTVPS